MKTTKVEILNYKPTFKHKDKDSLQAKHPFPQTNTNLNDPFNKSIQEYRLPYIDKCSLYKSEKNKQLKELKDIKEKYSIRLEEFLHSPNTKNNTASCYKLWTLINDCNKEILAYAKQNNIDFIEFLNTSTEELERATKDIDKINKTIKKYNPQALSNHQILSFSSTPIKKLTLTPEQKSTAHLIIHSSSAVCAGISAYIGEACITGADLPFICGVETNMFYQLGNTLGIPLTTNMLHGAKHMFSAKMVGGNLLKWLNGTVSDIGHLTSLLSGFGLSNAAISTYLRGSNGSLSALFCEYMGWAFIKDYEDGRMTSENKMRELIAFGTFMGITYGIENYFSLSKPIEKLEKKASEKLGMLLVQNANKKVFQFIKSSMEFLNYSPASKLTKGIEIVVPAIASHIVENKGKLEDNFVENVIKGSIYSLVCSEVFENITDNKIFQERSKQLIIVMKESPEISKILDSYLATQGISDAGRVILNKDTIKNLQTLYNDVIPLIKDIIKNMKGK